MTTYVPEQILLPPCNDEHVGIEASTRVYSTCFSYNGKMLAVGIHDCVYVWDTNEWRLQLCYRKKASNILALAWDRSGRLYFGCNEGWLTIVNFHNRVYRSEGFWATQKPIEHIAVSNARNIVALAGHDEVTLWTFKKRGDGPYHDWRFLQKLNRPLDENDETNVSITGLAWAFDHSTHLVVSYLKQGIITWDTTTYKPLFETGRIYCGNSTDLGHVLAGGSQFYAIPFENQIRVYRRRNGNNHRCLDSPTQIPFGSPLIWAHGDSCILGGLGSSLVLWHIARRDFLSFEIQDHGNITHLAWTRVQNSDQVIYRIAAITESPKAIHIWRVNVRRNASVHGRRYIVALMLLLAFASLRLLNVIQL